MAFLASIYIIIMTYIIYIHFSTKISSFPINFLLNLKFPKQGDHTYCSYCSVWPFKRHKEIPSLSGEGARPLNCCTQPRYWFCRQPERKTSNRRPPRARHSYVCTYSSSNATVLQTLRIAKVLEEKIEDCRTAESPKGRTCGASEASESASGK